jgi:Ca2+-binding EF-hand superfamily protein
MYSNAQTADTEDWQATIRSALAKYFNCSGIDGDGFLQFQGFRRLMDYLGARLTEAQSQDMFRRFDRDRDGSIDIGDFINGWMA